MATEQKMQQAVSAAKSTADSAAERVSHTAHEAVDSLSAYGARAEERLRDSGRRAAELSREYADQVSNYVTTRPLTSIAIAVGVGLLFGLRMRGR